MATHHHELSDDEKLLDLLRLVVTRHPSAASVIDDVFQDSPHLATAGLTFTYRETNAGSEHECRCHYDHEYMTYITDTGIDFDKFSQIAKNVVKGSCRHASWSDSPVSPATPPAFFLSKCQDMRLRNTRRYSVDFDIGKGHTQSSGCKRLVSRRSSSSLRSLEAAEIGSSRGVTNLISRRSSASLRSLALEIEDSLGETQTSLVHAAAAVGNGALVLLLLRWAKTPLLQVGRFQMSPLHLAIVKNRMCYVRELILRPEIYIANHAGIFRYAEIVKDEHNHSSLNVSKISLVGLCVIADDLDTLSALLNSSLLGELSLQRGLREAVEHNSPDAVDLLFKHGARPDIDIMKIAATRSTAVFETVFRKFRKDFKVYALKHPDRLTKELLVPAILARKAGVVHLLVANGAPVTCR